MLVTVDPQIYRSLGVTDEEFAKIVKLLGREPNYTELAMFSVMWSEHCSYKSSRIHLKRLPSKAPHVIMGPGENAGVIEATPEISIAIRMESHNHPSAIEPAQGAATGVGGILRDIFTVGARPIALLDSLWMGDQEEPVSRWIFDGVVSGISGYGNAVGVPTVGGEIHFANPYGTNPLVNVVAVGVAKREKLVRAQATGAGNYAVLLGAATGRDGIGGVSVLASSGFDEQTAEKRPSVQVGDPFEEKKLIEACLALLDAELVEGIQDLGGAGITCATSETAANAGNGMEIWLDRVDLREPGLTPMEILCSESQERMLAIVSPENLDAVFDACRRFEVNAAVIGVVTPPEEGEGAAAGILRAYDTRGGELVAEMPAAALTEDAPLYDRPRREPANRAELRSREVVAPSSWRELLLEVVVRLSYDPSQIYRRYDHMLFRNTLIGPGADAALLRVAAPGAGTTGLAMGLSVDGNQLWSRADPRAGTLAVVAESIANLACAGAEAKALVDCLNFGNPENPEVMWQLSEAIDGIAEICLELGVPVVGGNVSLYNEAHGTDIDPTPVVATVGLRPLPTSPPPHPASASGSLVLIGTGEPSTLTGSVLADILGDRSGTFPKIDLQAFNRLIGFVIDRVRNDASITAVHNLGAGGLAHGLWWLANSASTGLELAAPLQSAEEALGEHPSRFLIATSAPKELIGKAQRAGLDARLVGSLGGESDRRALLAALA